MQGRLSREAYLATYRRQTAISLVQVAVAGLFMFGCLTFHGPDVYLWGLAGLVAALRVGRWLWIRPNIAMRLRDAGQPLWLTGIADASMVTGMGLWIGLGLALKTVHVDGGHLLGLVLPALPLALPVVLFNRYLHRVLRRESVS